MIQKMRLLLYVWIILHHAAVEVIYCLPDLRFQPDGRFKILQVADMHYANGATTKCEDVLPKEYKTCSDLNTTVFIERLIAAEKPDLIVFSGDNIFGRDASDPESSMNAAFAPAIDAGVPWAAILGNHDQESTLSRLEVMEHIAKMEHTLSRVYPLSKSGSNMTEVDGFGNYHLEIRGAMGSPFENQSVLNLFLLDSGDYSKAIRVHGYGWIQESQKKWFKELSAKLKDDFRKDPTVQNVSTPAMVYFHIPLVETRQVASRCSVTGVKQEDIGCAHINSGFLDAMREVGNPHVVFNGHDHVNDFCGELAENIQMCYGGGAGYHAYGKAGWARRARVVDVSLRNFGSDMLVSNASVSRRFNYSKAIAQQPQIWLEVDQIVTWKRLDRPSSLPKIDHEVLWSRLAIRLEGKYRQGWNAWLITIVGIYLVICFITCFSRWRLNCTQCFPFSSSSLQGRQSDGYTICKSHSSRLFELHAC